MKAGLPISLLLHGAVMFGALLFSGNVQPLAEGRIIPIELIAVAPETNIKAAIKAVKPEQIKDEQPELQLEEPDVSAPEIAQEVKKTPSETPEPVKTAEVIVPDDTAKELVDDPVVPDTPPEPEPETFSLDSLAGLIDKSRETAPDKNKQVTFQSETNQYAFADNARKAEGAGTAMTLSELDALQSAMYKCWRMPADAIDPEKLLVRLNVTMLRGGLVEDVRLIDSAKSRRNAPGNPFWDIAEQRAIRAVAQCAPYDFLPDEKFNDWQSLILNFRPQL
ncbi:MAG: hypothetical protein ABJG88_11790 [Litorimonas sp.]